jgi:O-antigen ligase
MNSIRNQVQKIIFSSLIFFICMFCIVGYFFFSYVFLLVPIIAFHLLALLLFESLRNKAQKVLFILLGITIPTSIAITNLVIIMLVLCWISEWIVFIWIYVFPRYVWYDHLQSENFKLNVFKRLKLYRTKWKWMLSIFGLIGLYALGLYWGDNHLNAEWQFQRLPLLLVFPILATIAISQLTIKRSVMAFLGTTFISALAAILINNKIIEPLGDYIYFIKDDWRISAFITYNYHNVLLALSVILSLYILIEKKTKYNYLLMIFIAVYALSIFTERGRAGQVIFNLSALFYIIYYNRKQFLRLLAFIILLFSFQFIVYKTTKVYKNRFDAVSNIIINKGEAGKGKLEDIRYVFVRESFNRILQKPILGYGTGSFGKIFIDEVDSGHDFYPHTTPHNQYLYVWFELGILGLLLLLSIFYYQIKELIVKKDGIHRVLLPLSFIFLMLVDSYFFIYILTIAYIFLYTIYSRYESE